MLLSLGVLQPAVAIADDASFYGDGATVYALKESRIRMQQENIVIRHDSAVPNRPWKADCTFVFVNTSDQVIDLQMGFPDWRSFGDGPETRGWAIQGFQVEIDGKTTPTVHKSVDRDAARGIPRLPKGSEAEYEGAYTWNVHFPARGTVVVHNSYVFGGLSTNGPFTTVYSQPGFPKDSLYWRTRGRNRKVDGCDFDDALYQRIQYIVTTARTWGGSIGEADIRIQIPAEALPHQLVPSPKATSIGGGFVRWHRTNWTPTQEVALFFATPLGEKCRRPPLFHSEELTNAWIRVAKANGVERDTVELLRDAYLARHGAVFADPARNSFFVNLFEEPPPVAQGQPKLPPREAKIVALLEQFVESLPDAATSTGSGIK